MTIRIKRIDQSLPLPEYKTPGSCAFDIYSRQTITIEPSQISMLPSNLIIGVPSDHVLLITPRSSLALKKGLTMPNSVGVIDQDFSGPDDEIHVLLQNQTDQPVTIKQGERIAQGLLVKISRAEWDEASPANQTSRGGFGSTGGYKE